EHLAQQRRSSEQTRGSQHRQDTEQSDTPDCLSSGDRPTPPPMDRHDDESTERGLREATCLDQSSTPDSGRPAETPPRHDAQDEDTLHDAFVDIEEWMKEQLRVTGIGEHVKLRTRNK